MCPWTLWTTNYTSSLTVKLDSQQQRRVGRPSSIPWPTQWQCSLPQQLSSHRCLLWSPGGGREGGREGVNEGGTERGCAWWMRSSKTRSSDCCLPSSELSPALRSPLSAVWGTEQVAAIPPVPLSSPSTSPRPGIKKKLGLNILYSTGSSYCYSMARKGTQVAIHASS